MAKPQNKKQQQAPEERDDGLREKMVAINRVTKVVKGAYSRLCSPDCGG